MKKFIKMTAMVLALCLMLVSTAYAGTGDGFDTPIDELTGTDYFSDIVMGHDMRSWGDTRYSTAKSTADEFCKVTEQGGGNLANLIIACGGPAATSFADALAGSYLASVLKAPILIIANNTGHTGLDVITKYIKNNLNSKGNIYILGGEAAVASSVVNSIKAAMSGTSDADKASRIHRLSGDDRYLTNLDILEEAGDLVSTKPKELLICCGRTFPDALSVSSLGMPILLIDGIKSLSRKQIEWIQDGGYEQIYVIGGTAVISDAILTEVTTASGLTFYNDLSLKGVHRIFGEDRYKTSVKIAEAFFSDSTANITIASGLNYPDGLTGGVLSNHLGAPLVLTNYSNRATLEKYMDDNNFKNILVYGGEAAISADYYTELVSHLSSD